MFKKYFLKEILFCLVLLCFCLVFVNQGWANLSADDYSYMELGGTLAGTPSYDWWYGCSPTSAGMLMGYYDIHGYAGLTYDNLVPGGDAELSNYGIDSDGDTVPTALCNKTIASAGHIADFWVGYGLSADTGHPDPLASGRTIPDDFDSLADFMGTSQDGLTGLWGPINVGDGGTLFVFEETGLPVYAGDLIFWNLHEYDGMVGITEYVQYAGYDYVESGTYSQLTDNNPLGGLPGGTAPVLTESFTFEDYKAEIDAGRPVLIHVIGHTMLGYGYDETGGSQTVNLYNTWWEGGDTMEWGGSYGTYPDGTEMLMYQVTCLELTDGDFEPGPSVPEPSTLFLVIGGFFGLAAVKRRRS
ncbi:MAG: PEP-CTERM sorting domain-containing protein [bacterium]